jgi:Arc/MetJ-type ribon-helix-helix transcriptional regulator
MTIHLPSDVEDFIRSRVSCGQYASPEEAVTDAVRRLMRDGASADRGGEPTPIEADPEGSHKPIWEEFQEIARSVPSEVWDSLPTDLAEQHDHYIYGGPKRSTP